MVQVVRLDETMDGGLAVGAGSGPPAIRGDLPHPDMTAAMVPRRTSLTFIIGGLVTVRMGLQE
jgi:hypothetical protein